MSCLILDMNMPGITGLEVQQQISATNASPVIFLTEHGDIPSSVTAMKTIASDISAKAIR